ncbi:nucleoside recognition domain-containing protein [Algibacillus agarilyticus]|uniref:nucleoside recognition domain-containing protein n=1 Tax=Algibacillus agarilyticus TaxID=2234133 RepID=UPI000DD0A2E2|nr:spore maturation protein [Algibacillus agarilyticus]
MLNKIWLAFILSAFGFACFNAVYLGDGLIFEQMMQSVFSMAKVTVELSIGLIGLMAFWLGVSRIAEKNGLVSQLSRLLTPVFTKIMPEVPRNHPALGHITMNMAANVMGLDNAATPLGLKAMRSLQSLNPIPDTASNAQIMFLVLNTSSITLFPITVFMYRAQQGALQPTDVFLPILLATMASTLAGFMAVCFVQKINLLRIKSLIILSLIIGFCVAMVTLLITLSVEQLNYFSSVSANFLILLFIVIVLFVGHIKKLNVYDEFVEGAKEGCTIALSIIPYLLAMLVAIGLLRSSGLLDGLLHLITMVVASLNGDTRFVDALPVAFLKPLSGSGARAMMVETMQNYGADSFAGRLAAILQGSTETTFYVLAVYFGSVGIKYVRHALTCGLIADLAGILAAIGVTYLFYA